MTIHTNITNPYDHHAYNTAMSDTSIAATFPDADATCESCGYSLQGLTLNNNCPECGTPIADSSPQTRPGLPWQNSYTPWAWLATAASTAVRPGWTFRRMRLGGSRRADRLFLATLTILCVMVWMMLNLTGLANWYGIVIGLLIVAMTYIEAAGVFIFSKRKGWNVPWPLAERIVCYSSIGWLPATMVLAKVWVLYKRSTLNNWIPDTTLVSPLFVELILLAIIFGASTLVFEVLVWTGVRRTRFGNAPPSPPPPESPGSPEPGIDGT